MSNLRICRKKYYAYFWCADTGRLLIRASGNTTTLLSVDIKEKRKMLEARGFDYILQDEGDFEYV